MTAQHTSPLQSLLVARDFDADVYANEPMARHTTYRIGGPARFYVRVHRLGSLTRLVKECKALEIPWTIVGRGSNLLVADDGFEGVVITLGNDFRSFHTDKEEARIVAGAGVNLSTVVQEAFRGSFGGLEFAVGTPGSLGGALRMNAGSASEWIGSRVRSVTTLASDGTLRLRRGDEIEWGYRRTSFDPDEIILECELALTPADPIYIRGKMEANLTRRKKAQPLSEPSCGSVFKNPKDPADLEKSLSAGALIEASGLKGSRRGDAQVSPVHANFIVNTGQARAWDVIALITAIVDKVGQDHGIRLEPEVRTLGF